MSLGEYRRKRDPARTPEPFAEGGAPSEAPIFVVQRHDARRLHYDFRLERNGALASWAVPKGVPLEPGARSLAVHVEDHPLDYATFEGEIPQGEYGAGSVEVFDHGTYELIDEKRDGRLTVRLHGRRLKGEWTLVPARLDGKEENWLLIKRRDGAAPEPVERHMYAPMLATQADVVPSGPGWSFEVKFDGYRAVAYVEGSEARLVSRNGKELTQRFPDVAKEVGRAVKTPTRSWTARCAGSTPAVARASRSCSAAQGSSSTTSSTCSRPTGSRSSIFRCTSGGRGCAGSSTPATRRCAARRTSPTAPPCSPPPTSRGSKA